MARISTLEFDSNGEKTRAAAKTGPVIVTENERPSFVLLNFEDYERLITGHRTMGEMLYMPGLADIDFDLPERGGANRETKRDPE